MYIIQFLQHIFFCHKSLLDYLKLFSYYQAGLDFKQLTLRCELFVSRTVLMASEFLNIGSILYSSENRQLTNVCVLSEKKRNNKARKIEQKKNSIRSRSGRWRRSVFPTVPLFRVVGLRLSLLCCTPPAGINKTWLASQQKRNSVSLPVYLCLSPWQPSFARGVADLVGVNDYNYLAFLFNFFF